MSLFQRGMKCLKDNGLRYTINNIKGKIVRWFRKKLILHNYYDDLRNRVNNYQSRYPLAPRRTALRLLWWNFKQLFKRHDILSTAPPKKPSGGGNQNLQNTGKIVLDPQKINVAFLLCGGLGDFLIDANFIQVFGEKYKDDLLSIDVVPKRSINAARFIFEGHIGSTIAAIYSLEEYKKAEKDYDLVFELNRYPRILHRRGARIAEKIPELLNYTYLCEKFRTESDRFFSIAPRMDGQGSMISIIEGKNRVQQIDIYNHFGIEKDLRFPLYIKDSCVLSDQKLDMKPFITIHRGCDEKSPQNSVKLWPQIYYDILVRLIKKHYPNLCIVQLGINEDRCKPMCGVDINLVGKTSLRDIATLLRHSMIHIDSEGGMVHLRAALHGGKSIVMFGPTSPEFFGYEGNENLRGDGCATWCEWVPHDWQEKCIRGLDGPPCMRSIVPETVMESVKKIMSGIEVGERQ